MKYLLPLFLCLTATACGTAPMHSPEDLAVYTRCDPARIAYWISNRIEYHEQGPYWLPAGASMTLERGDCKAKAVVAKESLDRCVGYEARIVSLRNGEKAHAVTVFTDHEGRRGFIDSGTYKIFPMDTPWSIIIQAIPGCPWTEL